MRACAPGPKGSENTAQFALTRCNKNKENCINKKCDECREKEQSENPTVNRLYTLMMMMMIIMIK